MRAINPGATVELVYPSEEELPEADRTVWPIRIPNMDEQDELRRRLTAEVREQRSRTVGAGRKSPKAERHTLKLFLHQPRNFMNGDGRELEWTTERYLDREDAPSEDYLNHIPPAVRQWLAGQIATAGRLDEEEVGKS